MKKIQWIGSSLEAVRSFPAEARQEVGYQLDRVQRGLLPSDWKPMAAIGREVMEIRIIECSGQYRVIYLASSQEAIYVLHAFHKKSQKTSRQDIELARARFREIVR